jgi:Flp pilus assembly protein TadD
MATQLIEPYLVLTGRTGRDARTGGGRAELNGAIAILRRVTESNPQHWQAFWFIGKAYQAQREHQASYVAFKQSLGLKPANPNVAREFVIEAICVHATGEAVSAARDVASANASDAGLLANLGLALLADGQISQARDTTERALAMSPSDRVTQGLLGEVMQVQRGRAPANYCPP